MSFLFANLHAQYRIAEASWMLLVRYNLQLNLMSMTIALYLDNNVGKAYSTVHFGILKSLRHIM